MPQRRQALAHRGQPFRVHLRHHHAFPFGQHRTHLAPRVHQHGMPPRATTRRMRAALARGQHIALPLHRAGAQQQFPMRLTRRIGEGRRHHHQVQRRHLPVQLRKAQVIADRQADPQQGPVHRHVCHHRRAPRMNGHGLVIRLVATLETEQVDLVIARQPPPVRAIHQQAVAHLVDLRRTHGYRPAQHRHPVPAGRIRQEALQGHLRLGLHRPLARVRLHDAQLVAVIAAHQAEILRQQRQPCALLRRLRQQAIGHRQVPVHLRPGHHLHRRHLDLHNHSSLGRPAS